MANGVKPETGFMPWKWIKSNVPVIAILLTMSGGAVSAYYTTKDDIKTAQTDIAQVKQQLLNMAENSKERQAIADRFYKSQDDLSFRVKNLEDTTAKLAEALTNFQRVQADQITAIRDGFATLREQVAVVASKVDDLRAARPQRTRYTK